MPTARHCSTPHCLDNSRPTSRQAGSCTTGCPTRAAGARKPFRTPAASPRRADAARVAWLQGPFPHPLGPTKDQTIALARRLGVLRRRLPRPTPWASCWQPPLTSGALSATKSLTILLATARGQPRSARWAEHVTRALLAADRPDGWEFVEKPLLAAQRQEGLRQTILESIDEAHPEAYRRMLRVIRENDLTRFSATIRAVDVWFGFGWDAMNARFAARALEQIESFLDDPKPEPWPSPMATRRRRISPCGRRPSKTPRMPWPRRSPCFRTRGPGPPVRRGPHLLLQTAPARSERRPRARAGRPRSARRPSCPARRLSGGDVFEVSGAPDGPDARQAQNAGRAGVGLDGEVANRSAVADHCPGTWTSVFQIA